MYVVIYKIRYLILYTMNKYKIRYLILYTINKYDKHFNFICYVNNIFYYNTI